ncbi:hypothetical protein [uncultured Gammaproteobacteria bacterium]|nr:hypothetical protein [uncultured Gammaproteobacteria bacterium]
MLDFQRELIKRQEHVSVAGCLGYDVLVAGGTIPLSLPWFQLLVV